MLQTNNTVTKASSYKLINLTSDMLSASVFAGIKQLILT